MSIAREARLLCLFANSKNLPSFCFDVRDFSMSLSCNDLSFISFWMICFIISSSSKSSANTAVSFIFKSSSLKLKSALCPISFSLRKISLFSMGFSTLIVMVAVLLSNSMFCKFSFIFLKHCLEYLDCLYRRILDERLILRFLRDFRLFLVNLRFHSCFFHQNT